MGGKPRPKKSSEGWKLMQLRISLCEIEPPIWRRVLVPADLELGNLHHVIQVVMDWEDYHLHEFVVGERRFAKPHPENEQEVEDEWCVDLEEVLPHRKAKLLYWYDFGDDWCHEVVLEGYVEQSRAEPGFRVLAGERAAPPEDAGGPHGYMEKLDMTRRPEEYDRQDVEEIVEWLGAGFDPERFDVHAADELLQSSFELCPE